MAAIKAEEKDMQEQVLTLSVKTGRLKTQEGERLVYAANQGQQT